MSNELKNGDLSDEIYREYVLPAGVYRIEDPKTLYWRSGGSTHRVVDSFGIVHCVPCNCAIRWMPRDRTKPVAF